MLRPTRTLVIAPLISLALVFLTRTVFAQAPPAPPQAVDAQQDLNVLERGPIHEAFAEPIALDIDPADAPIIDRAPPEPIDELPPEVRPEGNNVQWLSGYWMFSVEQDDFIWISGVWREIPPGRQWVPGHWSKVPGGFQWVSGFWAAAGQQEVQFLPQPPQTLEQGPVSPAPSTSHFWIPGCWTWNQARYVWRPGYWYAGQVGWIWTPDHYVWTPRGFVYVAGFWDYPLARRGLLFAPVFWNGHHRWHTLRYTPRHVVNSSLLLSSLYVNSPYRHYYFGFHPKYTQLGLRPWYDVHLRKHRGHSHFYDPFFAYHRWHDGRRDPHWIDNYRHHFDGLRKGAGAVGPRDGRANPNFDRRLPDEIVLKGKGPKGKNVLQASTNKLNNLVVPLGQFASNNNTKAKLQRVSQQQQLDALRGSDRVRNLARLRAQQEVLHKATNAGKAKGSQFVRDTLRLPEKYQAGKPITTNSTQRLRAETQVLGQGRSDLNRNATTSQATQIRRQLDLQSRGQANQQLETNRRLGEKQQTINNFLQNQQQRLREQARAGSSNTVQQSGKSRAIGSTPQSRTFQNALPTNRNWQIPTQRGNSQKVVSPPSNRSGQSFPQQFRGRSSSSNFSTQRATGQQFQRSRVQSPSASQSLRRSVGGGVQQLKAKRSRLGK